MQWEIFSSLLDVVAVDADAAPATVVWITMRWGGGGSLESLRAISFLSRATWI